MADGIRDLLECCEYEDEDIEHFLEAMVNQDSHQINEAFNVLLNPTIRPSKSSLYNLFDYQINHKSTISKIIRKKFPDFCVKHIEDFADPEPEKIGNHPK